MTSKQDKKRVDLDVRPYPSPFYSNYDYGGPEDGEEDGKVVGPGRGFFGEMDHYKSVEDFLEHARKRKHRKQALAKIAVKAEIKLSNASLLSLQLSSTSTRLVDDSTKQS